VKLTVFCTSLLTVVVIFNAFSMEKATIRADESTEITHLKDSFVDLSILIDKIDTELNQYRDRELLKAARSFSFTYAHRRESKPYILSAQPLSEQKEDIKEHFLTRYLGYIVNYAAYREKDETIESSVRQASDLLKSTDFQNDTPELRIQLLPVLQIANVIEQRMPFILEEIFKEEISKKIGRPLNDAVDALLSLVCRDFQAQFLIAKGHKDETADMSDFERCEEEDQNLRAMTQLWFEDVSIWLLKEQEDSQDSVQEKYEQFQKFRHRCTELRARRDQLKEKKREIKAQLRQIDPYTNITALLTDLGFEKFRFTVKRKKLNRSLVDNPLTALLRRYAFVEMCTQNRMGAFLLLQDMVFWLKENRDSLQILAQEIEKDPARYFDRELIALYEIHRKNCISIRGREDAKIAPQILEHFGYNASMKEMMQKDALLTTSGGTKEATLFAVLLYNDFFHYNRFAVHKDLDQLVETLSQEDEDINMLSIIEAAHERGLDGIVGDLINYCVRNEGTESLAHALPWPLFSSETGGTHYLRTMLKLFCLKAESLCAETGLPFAELLSAGHPTFSDDDRRLADSSLSHFASRAYDNMAGDSFLGLFHADSMRGVVHETTDDVIKSLAPGVVAGPFVTKIKKVIARAGILKYTRPHIRAMGGVLEFFKGMYCRVRTEGERNLIVEFFGEKKDTEDGRLVMITQASAGMPHADGVIVDDFFYKFSETKELRATELKHLFRAARGKQEPLFLWKKSLPDQFLKMEPHLKGSYSHTDPNGTKMNAAVLVFCDDQGSSTVRIVHESTGKLLHALPLPSLSCLCVTEKICVFASGETIHIIDSQTFKEIKTINLEHGTTIDRIVLLKDFLFVAVHRKKEAFLVKCSLTTDEKNSIKLPADGTIEFLVSVANSHIFAASESRIFIVNPVLHSIVKRFYVRSVPCLCVDSIGAKKLVLVDESLCLAMMDYTRLFEDESEERIERTLKLILEEAATFKKDKKK
jgi:hypothetical protein